MNKKVIFIGPYVGDFKQEVENFAPYANYIYETHKPCISVVASHFNRKILYPWADIFKPVDWLLTVDESSQECTYNTQIERKELNKLTTKLKEEIIKETNVLVNDLKQFNINYLQTPNRVSIDERVFASIKANKDKEDFILFIPDCSASEIQTNEIYDILCKEYNVKILGDRKTNLWEFNELSPKEDYVEVVYEHTIQEMQKACLIICPVSHWTQLANQMRAPVFSWGENKSLYEIGGVYNFNNYRSSFLVTDRDTPGKNIANQIKWVLENKLKQSRFKLYLNNK